MKKLLFMTVLCAAFMSCGNKADKNVETAGNDTIKVENEPVCYEGVLPAADCPGIRYNFAMLNDSTVSVIRTYIEAEDGKDVSDTIEFKKEAVTKTVNGKDVEGFKLIPSVDTEREMYFTMPNDSTVRIVNDALEEAASELNYDLKKVK